MAKQDDIDRYLDAARAMQAGVALEYEHSGVEATKYLRVGVNSALVDSGAMATLLVSKGVITEEEYLKAIADGMDKEVELYTEHLKGLTGANIVLR